MTQRKKTALIAVVVAVISGFALFLLPYPVSVWLLYGARQHPQHALEQLVSHNVRTGERPEQVIQFLDREHLEHSRLERLKEIDSDKQYYAVGTPIIKAIKRRTTTGLLGFQSLQVVFVFNENAKLVRFDVRPVYTAP